MWSNAASTSAFDRPWSAIFRSFQSSHLKDRISHSGRHSMRDRELARSAREPTEMAPTGAAIRWCSALTAGDAGAVPDGHGETAEDGRAVSGGRRVQEKGGA